MKLIRMAFASVSLLISALLHAAPTVNFVSVPSDNSAHTGGVTFDRTTAPLSTAPANALLDVMCTVRNEYSTWSVSASGGQSWTSLSNLGNGSTASRHFWAVFNGTWSANPVFTHDAGTEASSCSMYVISESGYTWSEDVAEVASTYNGPSSPYDVSRSGLTATTAGITLYDWETGTNWTTWTLQSGNAASAGGIGQYRNTSGTGFSISRAYVAQAGGGATGTVTNRQGGTGGVGGHSFVHSYKKTVSAPPAGAIKFWPGHYAWALRTAYRVQTSDSLADWLAFIDSVGTNPNIVGIHINAFWGALECDTAGVYSCTQNDENGNPSPIGFALIDPLVAHAASYGKKLSIGVMHYMPGFADLNYGFPYYLWHDTTYGEVGTQYTVGSRTDFMEGGVMGMWPCASGNECATARLWSEPVMDRLIALTQAYGDRYNDDSTVVMFAPILNLSHTGDLTTLSNADLATQTIRMMSSGRTAWPNTELHIWLDYFGDGEAPSNTQIKSVVDAAVANKWVLGGNDVLPLEFVSDQQVFSGSNGYSPDYRGITPYASVISGPELCGHEGTNTPATLFNYAMDGGGPASTAAMRSQYFFWTQSVCDPSAYPDESWDAILDFIDSIGGAVGNGLDSTRRSPSSVRSNYCPTGYTGGCQ